MSARHTSELEALLVEEDFDGDVYPNEPMSRHTTYRIGGPARFFVRVGSVGALRRLVEECEATGTPWTVVGRGSNLLVSDDGYEGVVVALGRDFRSSRFDEETSRFCVGAGLALSAVVQGAFRRSLAGLEFAVGTPGSVGGAVRMNAGTRTEWMGARVASVTTYSPQAGLSRRAGRDMAWGYRTSSFRPDEVILECELSVEPADPGYIRAKMEGSLARRKKSQPLSDSSGGSVFKNPDGASAGALIEGVGLKGRTFGGAQVSPLHANFIVNAGGATARDVVELMDLAQREVYEAYGIELQPEIRFLGFA